MSGVRAICRADGNAPRRRPRRNGRSSETRPRPLRAEPRRRVRRRRQRLRRAGNGSAEAIVNAFTVDVEDYYMVSGFEKHISRDQWGEFESRVVPNTKRILRLLDAHDVKATFFVLGWVARHHPELVREIHAAGHEIGSHGYWHHLIYRQTPDEFRDDLRASRDVIEAAIDQRVEIYRAPSFSITEKSRWALDILTEEGFRIDSSIYPIHHDRYGIADAEPGLHQIATPTGPLWEFPPSVVSWKEVNLPVGGGGYFRLYPLPLTIRWLRQINRDGQRPFVFYVHPWEIDPDQPRIHDGSPSVPLSALREPVADRAQDRGTPGALPLRPDRAMSCPGSGISPARSGQGESTPDAPPTARRPQAHPSRPPPQPAPRTEPRLDAGHNEPYCRA